MLIQEMWGANHSNIFLVKYMILTGRSIFYFFFDFIIENILF